MLIASWSSEALTKIRILCKLLGQSFALKFKGEFLCSNFRTKYCFKTRLAQKVRRFPRNLCCELKLVISTSSEKSCSNFLFYFAVLISFLINSAPVTLPFIIFSFQFWKMFDFFVKVNLFGDSTLLKKTSQGIFFR